MKRPWTPGPWDYKDIAMTVSHHEHITEDRKLAAKAPEMAELLISLVECATDPNFIEKLHIIHGKAEQLLKGIGYEQED